MTIDALLLHHQIDQLNAAYAAALDEKRFGDWPDFFTDDARYWVQARENFDRKLPLALMALESKGMMKDRVYGITQTIYHGPYYMRHVVSPARVLADEGGVIQAQACGPGAPPVRFALEHLTLRGGNTGGGHVVSIQGQNATVVVSHCVFEGNVASNAARALLAIRTVKPVDVLENAFIGNAFAGRAIDVDLYAASQDDSAMRRVLGYLPQESSIFRRLTVRENLEFFASVFRTTVEANYALIRDIYVMLEPFAKRRAGALSGGMKQKLALCCALIHKPQVLVLDEPTTGVDAVSRREFWTMLRTLRDDGITILVSTPYMDEAALCDRVGLIQGGVQALSRSLFASRSSWVSDSLKLMLPRFTSVILMPISSRFGARWMIDAAMSPVIPPRLSRLLFCCTQTWPMTVFTLMKNLSLIHLSVCSLSMLPAAWPK